MKSLRLFGIVAAVFTGVLACTTPKTSAPERAIAPSLARKPVVRNKPPVAQFTKSCSGLTCKYASTSYDSDGSITETRWTFPNGDEYLTQSVSRTYNKAGTYRVYLKVTDNKGATDSTSDTVMVAPLPTNKPPVASFNANCSDLLCSFVNTSADSDGTVEKAVWDFGDSVVAESWDATHEFDHAGTFTVTLAVLDDKGAPATASKTVTTTFPEPTVGKGVPWGPYGGWGTAMVENGPMTLTMESYSAGNIVDRINYATSHGIKIQTAMTGGSYTNYLTNGVFDMAKWKAKQNTYNTAAIKAAVANAVANGVMRGNSVMDEPFNPKWGPSGTLTKAMVDQMCKYVKDMFPTLPVGVVHDHYIFEPTKSYYICDYTVSQYRWAKTKGDVVKFVNDGLAMARRDHMKIAFSLNILDGGIPDRTDGVYDCAGTGGIGTNYPVCRVTAAQLKSFSLTLGSAGCLYTNWRYDDAFMSKADNIAAYKAIGDSLAKIPTTSCMR